MSSLLLAVVITAGVHHHDHTPGCLYWLKRHSDCRTLVRYGSCKECGKDCTCGSERGYNWRADFDYLWKTKTYPPKCGSNPYPNRFGQPVVIPIEDSLQETVTSPETISPPSREPTLFDPS